MRKFLPLAIMALTAWNMQAAQFPVTVSVTDALCFGNCDGSATATPTGGTPPYTYNWNTIPVQTTATAVNLCSGTFTVIVLDAIGDTGIAVAVINEPAQLTTTMVVNDDVCPAACAGDATVSVGGGTVPYNYAWSTAANTFSINSLCAGTYTVTVTDGNACTIVDTAVVNMASGIAVSIDSIPAGCTQCDGQAWATPSGGTPPYTYLWDDPMMQTTDTCFMTCAGTYNVIVTDANSCAETVQVTLIDSCDLVWPGDANSDNIADNNDILAIGVGWGTMGPVRPSATLNWVGQPAFDWVDTLANGANYRHVDCNGDGIINDTDTDAVVLNFGFTHNKAPWQNLATGVDPPLTLNIQNATIGPNTQVVVTVDLGSSAQPVSAVYGLAFTIEYDSTLVQMGTEDFNYSSSWLGTLGADMIGIGYDVHANGDMHVGVSRTDQTDMSGFGEVGRFEFTTKSTLPPGVDSLNLNLTSVTVIESTEQPVLVQTINDSLVITGIQEHLAGVHFQVFPNPTSGILNVRTSSPQMAEVLDVAGRRVLALQPTRNSFQMDLNNLPDGVYFLRIGSAVEKVVLQH